MTEQVFGHPVSHYSLRTLVFLRMNPDLVSIGLPVRNGASYLRAALESIRAQSHRNIEIIISDNASTDNTHELVTSYLDCDTRIKYYRHTDLIPVADNFAFVLQQASGNFFMWAAHDDRRSVDYVELLLASLKGSSDSILSFGDFYSTSSIDANGSLVSFDFENKGLKQLQRVSKACNPMCGHLYGLWKTKDLRSIPIYPCKWAWDQPLMPAAAYIGTFIYTPGPRFYYLSRAKTHSERALYQDGKSNFNKYLCLLELFYYTFLASFKVGGLVAGLCAMISMVSLHIMNFPKHFLAKLFR